MHAVAEKETLLLDDHVKSLVSSFLDMRDDLQSKALDLELSQECAKKIHRMGNCLLASFVSACFLLIPVSFPLLLLISVLSGFAIEFLIRKSINIVQDV